MILPESYPLVLLLMILALLAWGSWANTYKLAGKYRFELYYLDFAFGFLLIALVLALTLGSLGFDGFQFRDDLEHAGKRQWFDAVAAGILFNFGNMLLLAAVSVAGMAISFTVSIGVAVIVSSILSAVLRPSGNLFILFAGCALVAAAVVIAAVVYNLMGMIRHEQLARAGRAKSTRRPGWRRGFRRSQSATAWL